MNILIVGRGGREHALGWKLSKSPKVSDIYFAPGNGATENVGENLAIDENDFESIKQACVLKNITFVVVGPETPLANGITDVLEKHGIAVFGPCSKGAMLESSKAYSKEFMKKYNIPTASFEVFTEHEKAFEHIKELPERIVIKASGLAGGKGAVISNSREESVEIIREIMVEKQFGDAGDSIVIEEFMEGEEASIFAICDGKNYRILPISQDHKRVGEGDTGLNTGGMGAYCPAPVVTDKILVQIEKEIVKPTLDGMIKENAPYKGILYVGVMINNEYAKVVEYNCRFGDPETQPVLFAIKEDIFDYLYGAAKGDISSTQQIDLNTPPCACVVITSQGYPGHFKKGVEISFDFKKVENGKIFHAGTEIKDSKLVSSGGRVLNCVAKGEDFDEAFKKAYELCDTVNMENKFFRKDIGYRVRKKY